MLTREQRKALKRVWLRLRSAEHGDSQLSYRELRRRVEPGPGCVMVPFFNMWLGIEPDGYTHS